MQVKFGVTFLPEGLSDFVEWVQYASAIIAASDRWHVDAWASRSKGLVDPRGRWRAA